MRGRTGLWLLSSDGRLASQDLNDHLEYLIELVFPMATSGACSAYRILMRDHGLEADVPCFWHGERGARPPVIREDIRDRLARIPAEIELDFDTD